MFWKLFAKFEMSSERKLESVKPISFCNVLLMYPNVIAFNSRLLVISPFELVDIRPISVPFLSTTAPPEAPF